MLSPYEMELIQKKKTPNNWRPLTWVKQSYSSQLCFYVDSLIENILKTGKKNIWGWVIEMPEYRNYTREPNWYCTSAYNFRETMKEYVTKLI